MGKEIRCIVSFGYLFSLPQAHNIADFFMLNEKQKLTIQHLHKFQEISDPEEIIAFCKKKLKQPPKRIKLAPPPKRKHTKKHYREIILHLRKSLLT